MAMKSAGKIDPRVALVGAGVVAFMLNWLSVYWFTYPFLYCWGEPAISPLYLAWGNIMNVIAICYFIYQGLRRNAMGMLTGGIIVVLVMGMPTFANTIFKLGGSCG